MKQYLERRIPLKSNLSNAQRKAWLSDPRARFDRIIGSGEVNYDAVARFFGVRGWNFDRIFVPAFRGDEMVFGFSDEAVGEISRACRADPALYGELFQESAQ